MKNSTLLHIPHASTVIPGNYLASFRQAILPHEIEVMTDWFCDELFDCGRDRIVFPISRLVCDVERFRDDKQEIMADIGMGVTYQCTSTLEPLRSITEDEKGEILSQYYDSHHENFERAVEKKLRTFGYCLIIDCHSFYPTALPYELCQTKSRPDFCIGTSDYHTPSKVVDQIACFLSECGYSVNVDSPFAGTIVPMKYYEKDKRVYSVMIEINRKTYMDMPGIKSAQFSVIHSVINECIERAEKAVGA